MLEIVDRVRAAMMKHAAGTRARPIILTELTWPAARRQDPEEAAARARDHHRRARSQRLTAAYKTLAKLRKTLHLTQAYWFAWATPYDNNIPQSDVGYRFTGLNR